MDEFNDMLSKEDLSEEQLNICRDIRRRGKNKVAAQNCRKRKLEQIEELQKKVEEARQRRQNMRREHERWGETTWSPVTSLLPSGYSVCTSPRRTHWPGWRTQFSPTTARTNTITRWSSRETRSRSYQRQQFQRWTDFQRWEFNISISDWPFCSPLNTFEVVFLPARISTLTTEWCLDNINSITSTTRDTWTGPGTNNVAIQNTICLYCWELYHFPRNGEYRRKLELTRCWHMYIVK